MNTPFTTPYLEHQTRLKQISTPKIKRVRPATPTADSAYLLIDPASGESVVAVLSEDIDSLELLPMPASRTPTARGKQKPFRIIRIPPQAVKRINQLIDSGREPLLEMGKEITEFHKRGRIKTDAHLSKSAEHAAKTGRTHSTQKIPAEIEKKILRDLGGLASNRAIARRHGVSEYKVRQLSKTL